MRVTVAMYQELERINQTEGDNIDKLAYSICALFGKTPDEVDLWSPKKFLKYANRVERLASKGFGRSWFRVPIETDATRITFGQFVELQEWIKRGVTEGLHLIAASLMKGGDHADRARQVLEMPVGEVLPPVGEFLQSWEDLMRSYSGLFEIEEQVVMDGLPEKKEDPHPFIEQYGWIFSATKVAEHEGVKLEEVWELPVVQALNDMAYLKSKGKYEEWLAKR